MSYNAETVPDLLGPEGPLAGTLESYEDRPFQREMALEVARLLEEGGRLIVPLAAPGANGRDQQTLFRLTRRGDLLEREDFGPCRFVPLKGRFGWPS